MSVLPVDHVEDQLGMRKMVLLSGIPNILPTHLDINRHHQLLFFLALFQSINVDLQLSSIQS